MLSSLGLGAGLEKETSRTEPGIIKTDQNAITHAQKLQTRTDMKKRKPHRPTWRETRYEDLTKVTTKQQHNGR